MRLCPITTDYRSHGHPSCYEQGEKARPDMRALQRAFDDRVRELSRNYRDCRVLDAGCGSGLSMEAAAADPHIAQVIGVDASESAIAFATRKFAGLGRRVVLVRSTLQDYGPPGPGVHLVLMASSYHHVADMEKASFLRKAGEILASDGRIIIAESMLPEYDLRRRESYRDAVRSLYRIVAQATEDATTNLHDWASSEVRSRVLKTLRGIATTGSDGFGEHKVCLAEFWKHVADASLIIESQERVWPAEERPDLRGGGNYLFILSRRDR